jgi:hypothetical protein
VASQNAVFKASDAKISVPVTKIITNDRIRKANDRYPIVRQPTLGEDTQKLDI